MDIEDRYDWQVAAEIENRAAKEFERLQAVGAARYDTMWLMANQEVLNIWYECGEYIPKKDYFNIPYYQKVLLSQFAWKICELWDTMKTE